MQWEISRLPLRLWETSIHHLWDNDTSVKRLLANPSWLAVPRSFLNKGREELPPSHNQHLGFSPIEALSAPPNAQLILNIPHSGQRNQPWALIIYSNTPAPLAASGVSGVCSDHKIRCCAHPGHLSPACRSSPATISSMQSFPFTPQDVFLFSTKHKLCSQLPFQSSAREP